jgi:NAD(P)-dependent dehydrogenase (short-subunit alcohol dehydrogenase family)
VLGLEGKRALVADGGSDIGRATARRLVGERTRVAFMSSPCVSQ